MHTVIDHYNKQVSIHKMGIGGFTILSPQCHVDVVYTNSLTFRLTDEKQFAFRASVIELKRTETYRLFFHVPNHATWAGRLSVKVH